MTKTENAITLFKQERYKEALRIFKTFKHGFSQKQMAIIAIAYEGYTESGSRFYSQIGKCITGYQFMAKMIIKMKYKI